MIGRSAAGLLGLLLALTGGACLARETPEGSSGDDRPSAGGRLIWDLAEELDLLGDLWVDLPFEIGSESFLFASVDTRTSIERAASDFAFEVRDLDYRLAAGWRGRRFAGGRRRLSLFLGQLGKQRVDADGQPWVRYLGAALESPGFRRFDGAPACTGCPRRPLEWKVSGGPVFDDRELQAEFVARASARHRLPFLDRHSGVSLSAELEADGLIAGGRIAADVAAGPRLSLAVRGDREASLFLHYQRSRHPLGIGHSALLAGFAYSEGIGAGAGKGPPEIDGAIAAGGGDGGRLSGQLLLRFLSPRFAERFHGVFVVDANILTAEETGDLFYLYHLGIERSAAGHRAGLYFYHRSNHQLAEPNDLVTSINVLEAGLESSGWNRFAGLHSAAKRRALEFRGRVGYLLDSEFGLDRRWHARGGLRWFPPLAIRGARPFVTLEAETGDVDRRGAALGLSLRSGLDVQVEYRDDDQLFSRDRTALLLTTRYGF